MPVDKWITTREVIFQAFSVSRIYKFCSWCFLAPRGFALSLDCGEHCWLDHIRGRKILLLPESLSRARYSETTPHEDFYRPCRHIRIVFINPGSRRDRTLRPVKGGLRPLNHTPEINNAEFYDNVIAGNFPDRFSRFSGGNNPVPCHADLLAKAINPCGLAFGQLRCIRKNAAYPDISLGNLNSDIYAWDPVNRR